MDDNTFFEEADNDDCPMEGPFRVPTKERPEISQAIFDLIEGRIVNIPVNHVDYPDIVHLSVHFDEDPTSDDAFILMTIKANSGEYHTGFYATNNMETLDWDSMNPMIDEVVEHDESTDFNFVYTAESLFYAKEDWDDMTDIIRMDGIAVLQAYVEALEDCDSTDSLY